MSSSSSNPSPNGSFSRFQDLFNAALKEYSQKTGKDIATDPLTTKLLPCDTPEAVLAILKEQACAFNQFRNGNRKVQLMRRLKPTIDIPLALSTGGVFGEAIGLVRQTTSTYYLRKFIVHPVGICTSEGNICWCWSPTCSMYPLRLLACVCSLDTQILRLLRVLAPVMMRLSNFLNVSNITLSVSESSWTSPRSPKLWEKYRSK